MKACPLSGGARAAVLLLVFLSGCAPAGPVPPGGPVGGSDPRALQWCGMLALPDETPDGDALGGLSALTFDDERDLLYLLSDRGTLHHARLHGASDGAIERLELLESYPLVDRDGQRLKGARADSESMALIEEAGERALLIGFERHHRLQRFSLEGRALTAPSVPEALEGAACNGSLEGLTHHPRRGVIAGLEYASQGMDERHSRLFDLDGVRFRWRRAHPNSGLTDFAPLGEGLLMLERDFRIGRPLTITLSRAEFRDEEGERGDNGVLAGEVIARLASDEGWRLDNFEGLTRLGDGRYLMVSDDNFSLLQRSLLACFRLPAP